MNPSTSTRAAILQFLLVAFGLLSSLQVFGQWIQTDGPQGGNIRSLERVGNQVWAAASNGVFVSSNEGNSWNIHPEFNFRKCSSIRCFNDSVIVLYSDYVSDFDFTEPAVYTRRSLDGGATWENPVEIVQGFLGMDIEKDSLVRINNNLYILDFYSESFVSEDFGQTWESFTNPGFNTALVRVIGKYGLVSENFGDFQYYNEKLQTWSAIYNSTFGDEPVILSDSTFMVAEVDNGTNEGIVKITNDYGNTWQTTYTFTLPCCTDPRFESYEGAIYLKYLNTVVKSIDNGLTWTPAIEPPVFNMYPSINYGEYKYEYLKLSNNNLLIASANGVRQCPEDFSSTIETNTGLKTFKINKLVENNTVLYASTDYRTFRSMNGGLNWTQFPDSFKTVVSFAFSGDSLFFLCRSNALPFLMISYNNGQTWIKRQSPYTTGVSDILSLDYRNGKLFAGIGNKIWRSNNFANSWTALPVWDDNNGGSGGSIEKNGHTKFYHDTLYVYSLDGVIFRFNEGNQTWTYLSTASTPGVLSLLNFTTSGNVIFAIGRDIFKYSINGSSWISPIGGSGEKPNNVVVKDGVWYGSFYADGVLTSTNLGVTWTPLESNVSFNASGGLVFLNTILYSASDNSGVWRRTGPLTEISGNVYRDINNNGIKDSEDYNLEGIIIKSSPSSISTASYNNGNYSLITDIIGDTLSAHLASSEWTLNPPYYITSGEATNQNFGIYVNEGISDLSIDLTNVNVFRPGFTTNLTLTISNNSSLVQSPVVKLVLDENITLLNSIPEISSQQQDTLIWNLSALNFWESNQISVQVSSSQSAVLGENVNCYASVSPVESDVTPDNNISELTSLYVGSYDPNDKRCLQGDYYTIQQLQNGEELEFLIRFQNTGTFQADNVKVSDTLSHYLDISTLRILGNSHPVRLEVSGSNIIDFMFDQIFLPDSFMNEPLSHGFIKYAVKCKPDISIGNAITNTAYIYFDFNEPVITNTTTTLHVYPLILLNENPTEEIVINSILVFPNPAKEYLSIDTRGIEELDLMLILYDSKGACVRNQKIFNPLETISLEGLSTGIYFGIITNSDTKMIGNFKFIRE